jgi:ribonuclease T1
MSACKWALALMAASAALVGAVQARPAPGEVNTVALADLPVEARQTDKLIRSGGPFPYTKDGTVFGNRERLLPREPRGWYREYTVKTPGSRDRGARRIVCGGEPATAPKSCYYTADHYASFRRIVP